MGEMADMMLSGLMCGMCGVFIGQQTGHPLYCSKECAKDAGAPENLVYEPDDELLRGK